MAPNTPRIKEEEVAPRRSERISNHRLHNPAPQYAPATRKITKKKKKTTPAVRFVARPKKELVENEAALGQEHQAKPAKKVLIKLHISASVVKLAKEPKLTVKFSATVVALSKLL